MRICLSPTLDSFLDKVQAYKMLNDKNIQTSEHYNSFPISQNLDFCHLLCDMMSSGCNDDAVDNSRKPKDILPRAKIIIDPSAANILHICLI